MYPDWRPVVILSCIGLSCLTATVTLLLPVPHLTTACSSHSSEPTACSSSNSEPKTSSSSSSEHTMSRVMSVDFEVFGRVQGVFFRKHTQKTAARLGVVGWCRNSRHDTVQGQAQAAPAVLEEMKHWLRNVGSPQSKIERAEFSNYRHMEEAEFKSFSVRH